MNIKDLLCGMEDRAMDSQFLKDICAIYNPKDFGDTEPDCEVGYRHLLPLLTVDQKTSLEKMGRPISSAVRMLRSSASSAVCSVPSGSSLVHPACRTLGFRTFSVMIC